MQGIELARVAGEQGAIDGLRLRNPPDLMQCLACSIVDIARSQVLQAEVPFSTEDSNLRKDRALRYGFRCRRPPPRSGLSITQAGACS
jgi:hypothetical protein